MKRTKMLSCFMLLVALFSMLCTGVYSASIIQANIIGDISIIPLKIENVVKVTNEENLSVSIDCSIENAETMVTETIINSGIWNSGTLSFSAKKFQNQLLLDTLKIKMLVTNNGEDAISVSINADGNNTQDSSLIDVIVLGCSYIAPDDTEEISIQFAAKFSRGVNDGIAEVTAPTIATYAYNIDITEVATEQAALSRVEYTDNGIANNTLNFYIEYGDNPYYNETDATEQGENYAHSPKLRWFIWARADATGNPINLTPGTDYSGKSFLGGGSYYLISEYILDVEDVNMGLSFQSLYACSDENNMAGNYASDYAGSNFRNYLNGLTVKRSYLYTGSDTSRVYYNNGRNVNFLDRFNLTEDMIYSKIQDRRLKNIYEIDDNEIPSDYEGESDKFWALSEADWYYLVTSNYVFNNAISYKLSGGTGKSVADWWLRTPARYTGAYSKFVMSGGYNNEDYVNSDEIGVRPAFQIQI